MFRCNLPPELVTERPGSFTYHCGKTGGGGRGDGHRTSQYTKLTLKKEFLPPLLPEFGFATFRSRVWRSANKLSRLPKIYIKSKGILKQDPRLRSQLRWKRPFSTLFGVEHFISDFYLSGKTRIDRAGSSFQQKFFVFKLFFLTSSRAYYTCWPN